MTEAEQVLAWSLEGAFDAAWPGLRRVAVGDWLCKSAQGVSRRANSANPAGAHAVLSGAVAERIEAVYRKLCQPAYVRLPSLLGADADRLLQARGYELEGGTRTLIGALDAASAPGEAELEPLPSADWLQAQNRFNGREGETAAAFDAVLQQLDAPAAFAAVRREGQVVSAAYAALVDGWLCLEAVATDPSWRGQGLARAAVTSLMAWGAQHGARAAALQVTEGNEAALALYGKLGVARELYRYHYRREV